MTSLLRILASPLLWLASFSAIYGLQGLLCAAETKGWGLASVEPSVVVLGAAWFAAISLQVMLLWALRSRRYGTQSDFVRWVSLATGWTGLVATIWTLFPIVTTSTCG